MLRYFDKISFCKVHSVYPINVCANFEINSEDILSQGNCTHKPLTTFYWAIGLQCTRI